MTIHKRTAKAEACRLPPGEQGDVYERLRYAVASKLLTWHAHSAGKGSDYITIGETLKLRFADHENTSASHGAPDYNFVNRDPNEQEFNEITGRFEYPWVCKKTAFAKHVGLTAPKLKKLLPPDQHPQCYADICENDYYANSTTQYVVVEQALEALEAHGITARIPVRQETRSAEDYCGD